MSGTHPAHEKADYISKDVPEIASLYRSLGMKSYFDGKYLSFFLEPPEGYDPQRSIDPDIDRKKEQIDNLLWNLAYNELDNDPDTKHFKDAAVALAQQYVTLEWLHTPWLTSKILTQVLDSELVPLKREAFASGMPDTFSALIPGVRGVVLRTSLSLIHFVVLLVIAGALFNYHHPLLALLVTAYMVWVFAGKSIFSLSVRRERKRLAELHRQLHLIRDEVASGCFDPVEVDLRLRKSEENGLYVHSLSHALLKISTRLK